MSLPALPEGLKLLPGCRCHLLCSLRSSLCTEHIPPESNGVYLEEYFLGADISDSLDELGALGLSNRREPGHGELDHLYLCFLGLSSPVHQVGDLFVEFLPFFGLSAESDLSGMISTMSLRTATEVKCSLLTLAIFYLSRSRSSWSSKSEGLLLICLGCYLKTI